MNILLLSGFLLFSDVQQHTGYDMDVMGTMTYTAVVDMETIYELNRKSQDESFEYQGAGFLMQNETAIMEDGAWPVFAVTSSGYQDYECMSCEDGSSSEFPYIVLRHTLTGKRMELPAEEEELKEFVEETSEISERIRNRVIELQERFTEEQYGGIYYDYSTGFVTVYAVSDDICKVLEDENIKYQKTEISLKNLYESLEEVWNCREELGINYVRVNQRYNRLDIYTEDEEKLEKWLETAEIPNYQIYEEILLHPGDCQSPFRNDLQNTDTDNPEIVSYLHRKDESIYDKLKEGVRILKEAYPEYECRNLLIRIASDGNYQRYLDFDEELLSFVDALGPYVPNEKDPAEELLFGDPERIELKSLLREYRERYPDMSYQQIYEQYLSDWEDTTVCSREKKLFDLAVSRQIAGQNEGEKNNEENSSNFKNSWLVITAVSITVLICIGVWIVIRRRRKKR